MKRLISLATLSILAAACGNNDTSAPRNRAAVQPIEEDDNGDADAEAFERKMLADTDTVTAEEVKPEDEAKVEEEAKVEDAKSEEEVVEDAKKFPCKPTGKILKDLRARAKEIRQSDATKEEKKEQLKALRAEGKELIKAERARVKACRQEKRAAKAAE